MHYTLPYGRGQLAFQLPDTLRPDLIAPVEAEAAADPLGAVRAALDAPIGQQPLEAFAGARSVAIAINDKTRPVPLQQLLPPLLEHLHHLGVAPEAITFLIATGAHAPLPPAEFPAVLAPELLARYRVLSHDCDDGAALIALGNTERGTPIEVNRHFYEAELRITIGNIEPHQFAGFSGGVKTAAIGLGGRAGINRNHALMLLPEARIGEYAGNPARQDMEAMGAAIGIHFSLNAILNNRKQIVHVLFGAPAAVMQAGVPLSRAVCQIGVAAPYDLLIVSPGGHPKDINVYQAQKALGHAALIMRFGGTVILAAACPEGSGSQHYEAWMAHGSKSYAAVLDRFASEGFRLGPHKAFQIARDAARVQLHWLSDLAPERAAGLLLNPIAALQPAIDAALERLPPEARVGIMPNANATIPTLPARNYSDRSQS